MTKLTLSYRAFLKAGGSFKAEVMSALGRKKYLPDATVAALAAVHAEVSAVERPGVKAQLTETGRWTFYVDGKRCETTTKNWNRWVGCFHAAAKSARGGATSTQKDAVAKLVDTYERLSAAERRRFRRLIGAE
jgi:hypothetical protein